MKQGIGVEILILMFVTVGLVMLGWYAQTREHFEEKSQAFEERLDLLQSSREEDVEKDVVAPQNGDVYSFVANYCS